MAVFLSDSEGETAAWAAQYANTLHGGDTVLLEGEMGAGKTALAKGIARALGVEGEVTSPTYAYINSYELPQGKRAARLYHFDCYRVASEEQAERLGFSEYFDDADAVCLVEWGENIAGLLPPHARRVVLKKRGETAREIEF